MSTFKTSNKNFDASCKVYKFEEVEENEEITRQSPYGEISTSNRILPKVIRCFIRNDKKESQEYIDRQLISNSEREKLDKKLSNPTNDERFYGSPLPHQEITPLDYQKTLENENKSIHDDCPSDSCSQSRYRYQFQKYGEIAESDEVVCNNGSFNNYTLDYTSSNSTPSEKIYEIKPFLTSSSDNFTICGTKKKYGLKNRKSQTLFCKDPNKRLKNLFTVVKSKEKTYDDKVTSYHKRNDVELLRQTKELLVNLIDKELQRIQLNGDDDVNFCQKQIGVDTLNKCDLKTLKLESIRKIEDELRLLKRLEKE